MSMPHVMGLVFPRQMMDPGEGRAGYRGALILAMLLKLLLGLHLSRHRPEALHVQGDVHLQTVTLHLHVEIIKRNTSSSTVVQEGGGTASFFFSSPGSRTNRC